MPLTDVQIRNAKPRPEGIQKLSDGGGLQLWVTSTGGKLWCVAYRQDGKQRKLSLGAYPSVSLKVAREGREKLKTALASGIDPGQQKRAARAQKANIAANTFGIVGNELLAKKRREGAADATLTKVEWLLAFTRAKLGARPVAEISAPEVLAVLQTVEQRGRHETARRLRSTIGEVFRYAVATGRADNDPTFALRGALTRPKVKPRAALTDSRAFGGLLRAIDGYDGSPEVRIAMQILALTFVRPGELRMATWSEFDLGAALWSIPAARMKMRRPHRVPLARQTIELLRELHRITGRGALLFPSARSNERCMSDGTVNAALRRLGFTKEEMSGHGFRAVASTILNESGSWNPDAIEAQLAHVEGNDVRRAYQRAEFWNERVTMMSAWADQLDELRSYRRPTIDDGENLLDAR